MRPPLQSRPAFAVKCGTVGPSERRSTCAVSVMLSCCTSRKIKYGMDSYGDRDLLVTDEELRHVGGHGGQSGEVVNSGTDEDEAQSALMLVGRRGLVSLLGFRTDDKGRDLSRSV